MENKVKSSACSNCIKITQLLLVLMIVATGCSGGSSGTGSSSGNFSTGIEPSRKINSLTPSEVSTACKNLDSYASEKITDELGCNLSGIIFQDLFRPFDPTLPADRVQACEQIKGECLNDNSRDEEVIDCELEKEVARNQACQAVVAEYEVCVKTAIDALSDEFSDVSCDIAASKEQSDAIAIRLQNRANIAECAAVMTKCPGLLED